jgi:hypothetical protein
VTGRPTEAINKLVLTKGTFEVDTSKLTLNPPLDPRTCTIAGVVPKLKSGKCNVKGAPTGFSWVKASGKVSFQ